MTLTATERPSFGRGPDADDVKTERALVLMRETVLAGREVDKTLTSFADDWLAMERATLAAGLRPPGLDWASRELRNAVRQRAGEPFWNRDPAEPPPLLSPLEPA